MTNKEFIEKVGGMAAADQPKSGVLASLTIAQAILESGWGNSGLTRNGNALFGIKAGRDWAGKRIDSRTFEYYGGERVELTDCFRAYDSWEESVADHGAFLRGLSRYARVIGEKDYRKACREIQAAGYATAPNYAEVLIGLIEQYRLDRFDSRQAYWAVRIGRFGQKEAAERVSGQLRRLGFYNEIRQVDGMWQVEVFRFSDRERAEALAGILNEGWYSVVEERG